MQAVLTYIHAAAPAIEDYRATHNGYSGMTALLLRGYDPVAVHVDVVDAAKDTYCIEAKVETALVFKAGPRALALPGSCPH
jgi:hypothetical protein